MWSAGALIRTAFFGLFCYQTYVTMYLERGFSLTATAGMMLITLPLMGLITSFRWPYIYVPTGCVALRRTLFRSKIRVLMDGYHMDVPVLHHCLIYSKWSVENMHSIDDTNDRSAGSKLWPLVLNDVTVYLPIQKNKGSVDSDGGDDENTMLLADAGHYAKYLVSCQFRFAEDNEITDRIWTRINGLVACPF